MTFAGGEKIEPPIAYMARTRAYYRALGYERPYRWAENADRPFARPAKALSESRVAIVTTAARFDPAFGDHGPDAPYNAAAKFFAVYAETTAGDPDVRISHVTYDRLHGRPTDVNAYFPLAALRRAAAAGRIGGIAPRFFGLPTNRSQRTTMEVDAPALLAGLREDGVEAVVFVPNCPVCHQSVTLAARHVEAAGVPTVVMGAAKDIVEAAGAPRFVFSDFPLGCAAGKPGDPASQDAVLALALDALESASAPGETIVSPRRWAASDKWKRDFMAVERLTAEDLAKAKAAHDVGNAVAKGLRGAT